jgi:cyclophilin family peptidyl-prolyl cis-trans isomerase
MRLSTVLYGLLFLLTVSCNRNLSQSRWLDKKAPPVFLASFETTQGNFVVEFHREWSPLGVDRTYQLIRTRFYDRAGVFRVVKGFVAQFGISPDSAKNSFWENRILPDEPVIGQNTDGTLAYARSGPDTRSFQLYVNLKNNASRLDTLNMMGARGFPVIGKIVQGRPVIDRLYSGYGNGPDQDSISFYGNAYLRRNFPRLDYIKRARIIKDLRN